jgi:[ribosomal protein S18]-alanine N-acetyltransferase
MIEITHFNPEKLPDVAEKTAIVEFLFANLEQYGDPKNHIAEAVKFALKEIEAFGGVVIVAKIDETIVGAVVVNKTGMSGYIPENILVYIATDARHRGKGIGKQLMEATLSLTSGSIALHVEQNNPAKYLYEKFGFTNPYLEMRLKR